jgi:formylglycine-generating enzyme required for sulfatase activity
LEQSSSFRARLAQRPPRDPLAGSEDLWRYREAAAVLASFDYESLRSNGLVPPSSNAKAELLADCDVAYSDDGKATWSLRTSVRQAALRRLLAENGIQSALDSNPERTPSLSQTLFESYLRGEVPDTSDAEFAECARALLEITDWLDGIPELSSLLPSIDSIKHRLARWQFLQPFRGLVGSYFAGRTEELSRLADYVGVYDSAHLSESIGRTVEYIFSIHDRPPLFVNGPGGCGKSTLIAKFILLHAEIEESARFPFAYLDFDRPGLLAEEPVTLLMEVMRQLAIQYPELSEAYARLAEEWNGRVAKEQADGELTGPTYSVTTPGAPLQEARNAFRVSDRRHYMSDFVTFLTYIKRDDQPLLLVLDTFEEVQFRSSAFVDEVLQFLDDLQSMVPRLRTVLCGRADINSLRFKTRKIEIGNFDKDAAVSFLAGLGLKNTEVATKIFDQVGGSPLVLRLAADVARLESADRAGIDGLGTSWLSLFREKSIEVVLYKRILTHVRDKRVEKIAYPGLILRVMTPEIVQGVLAPACGVSVESLHDAQQLLGAMRTQLSTILTPSSSDEGVLVHRPDMRSILLYDLFQKAPKDKALSEKLSLIHRMAIDFYSNRDDPADRAEEIYHRLASGVDRKTLPGRWQDGLKPYLGSSIRELPSDSQIYLAARLNLELPLEQWTQAEDEDWVLYATRLVTQQLQVGRPFDAVSVLNQRRQVSQIPGMRPVVSLVTDAVFHDYAKQYEQIRETQEAGAARTRRMTALVNAVGVSTVDLSVDSSYAPKLFKEQRPGTRLVALGIIEEKPSPQHFDIAVEAIENALSPFEQFHGLVIAQSLLDGANNEQRKRLSQALLSQRGVPIHEADPSRASRRRALLKLLETKAVNQPELIDYALAKIDVSDRITYRDDPDERHGPFVLTRGQHVLDLPARFRMGVYPVTNQQFLQFIRDGGYSDDELWEGASRMGFVTQDKKTQGPSTWPSNTKCPPKRADHPVSGVSYVEARAFVKWLNLKYLDPEWHWCLPSEDMWEFSARSTVGLSYPWGREFLPNRCNSLESGIKGTSEVGQFREGNSYCGCAEMAGNVWEFVETPDRIGSRHCVLRGGSFRNNEYEVRSYVRLVSVPVDHRPSDFGLRCAQVVRSYPQPTSEQSDLDETPDENIVSSPKARMK